MKPRLLFALLLAAGCHPTPPPHAHGALPPHANDATAHDSPSVPAANPVQAEMRLLSAALESAVRGIGLGDVRALEHQLHAVHAAKEATEQALHTGAYRPAKNPDRIDRFRELDVAFHGTLEKLVAASRANDVGATVGALAEALGACQGCHAEFRP